VPAFTLGEDNKTPEFLAKSPTGKVPVLETDQGCIFGSGAVARFIARSRPHVELYGSTFFDSVWPAGHRLRRCRRAACALVS
jgi:elongation factor 1-gamma